MTSPNARPCVWPSLGYRNAPLVIEWLVEAFGLSKDLCRDLTATDDPDMQQAELSVLRKGFARVMTADEITSALGANT
jgi:hypothetical protein